MREDLTTLLTPVPHDGETPRAENTRILTEALCAALRPESILTWLRNPDLRLVLSRIANGQLPLTHEAFDAEPAGTRIEHLRSLLIHHGLLPERDQYLFRFEAWLDDKFKAIADSEIRRPVEQFVRWHHLRRIRSLSQEGRPTRASIISSKQEIIEATRFLTWLFHTCARTAEECTQADFDTWLADGTATRRAAKPFIRWAVKNRICGPISTGRHITKTVPMLTQDQRLEWLKRCLTSEIDTLAYRVAAVLVLLYGQPLARIVKMRTTDIVSIPAGP
ncbi:hypothetical protein, partial [Arthrobacter sp. H14]|uniref:hypothetical protein n=1 Tax=Arthrobacter sp. H14 TaxID=1312959 RepID=UPI00138ACD95